MAGVVQKLIRKPTALRLFTAVNNSQSLDHLVAPLIPHQPHYNNANKFKPDEPLNPNPVFGFLDREKINSSQPLHVYPSFPFGYFLNPISANVFDPLKEDDEVIGSGNDQTIWADSVKKKRKKKMNKHKYKKLRKRLRRQT